jgi:hypothetical protein
MDTNSEEHNLTIRDGVKIEYSSLRSEILKRIELRHQFMSITLTIAGVFLGIGITTAAVALVYPPLAAFLAMGWTHNDLQIRDLARYIRENLEAPHPGLGWETYAKKRRKETQQRSWRLGVLSHGGVLLFTQGMAIVVGLLKFSYTPVEWVFLGIDLVAVFVVFRLMKQAEK